MAYLINGVGTHATHRLKKIIYMAIYQIGYKFIVFEE